MLWDLRHCFHLELQTSSHLGHAEIQSPQWHDRIWECSCATLAFAASCLIWPALAESESARQMNCRCHTEPLTYLFRLWEWPECIRELVKVDLGQGGHIAIYYFMGEFIKIA
jgi:hypothetical protein